MDANNIDDRPIMPDLVILPSEAFLDVRMNIPFWLMRIVPPGCCSGCLFFPLVGPAEDNLRTCERKLHHLAAPHNKKMAAKMT